MVDRKMLLGFAGLLGLLSWAVFAGMRPAPMAGPVAAAFWQTSSALFVIGGSIVAGLLASPTVGIGRLLEIVRRAFRLPNVTAEETIITMVALSEIVRRDGWLAIEKPVASLKDDFTRRAAHMAIDGTDQEFVQSVMQAELESIDLRHAEGKGCLESMARFAPAFGMIGTVIGLILMLGRLDDPARIGPGMAVALLTTLYGLAFANLFCLPMARRLTYRSSQELLVKTIALKGILSIQAGDHPRVLTQKLRVYLPGAGQDQNFAWSTVERQQARLEEQESQAAKVAQQVVAATVVHEGRAKPVFTGVPAPTSVALDDANAKKLAAKLEQMIGRNKHDRKRLTDAV